jgi:hypothetical protein
VRIRVNLVPILFLSRSHAVRHETDLSYDVGEADSLVGISIEEARLTVDRALNSTVELLFHHHQHTNRNRDYSSRKCRSGSSVDPNSIGA